MAKNDNLQDFLTDVADAIRAKKGTTDKINPQDFSREIASIQSGVEPKEMKDVNFYDYDGTILYSYSWDEALQLTEMPPLPSHDGLICQGWNYTYEEMLAQDGLADIGAMYITDDGKTRLYITVDSIDTDEERRVDLAILRNMATFRINWGDGVVEEKKAESSTLYTHEYKNKGNYVIEIESISGALTFGHSSYGIMGNKGYSRNKLYRIEIGDNVINNQSHCFAYCYSLKTITLPMDFDITVVMLSSSSITHVNMPRTTNAFNQCVRDCKALRSITIPPTIPFISDIQRTIITHLILPNECKVRGTNFFLECKYLKKIRAIVTELPPQSFYSCSSLMSLPTLADTITSIGAGCFQGCYTIKRFVCPPSITTIGSSAFAYTSIAEYDFTKLPAPPTLVNTNAFAGIQSTAKFYIKAGTLADWLADSNWATFETKFEEV